MEEKALINACIKGEYKAQRILYDKYGSVLMGLCMRYAGNREDAEEIFHDSMLKVFNNLKVFKYQSSLKTWISRIGINTALDFLRKKKNALLIEHISDRVLEIKDSDIDNEISLEAEVAMKLLHTLSTNQQIIINLYVIDEMSHKEIATQLGISEEASRSQLSRAKKTLADMIKLKIMTNESAK